MVPDNPNRMKLKDIKGIGTPATRARIIDELLAICLSGHPVRPFLTKKGKDLIPTDFGFFTIDHIHESLTKPDLTADIEFQLSEIVKNESLADATMERMIEMVKDNIAFADSSTFPPPKDAVPCSVCHKGYLARHTMKDGKGAYYRCCDSNCVSPVALCYVHKITFTHSESFQLFDVLFISFFDASYFFFLKLIIHKAYTLQMIPFDYSQGIIIPRKSRNLSIKVFSKEDIQAFLDYFASHKTFLHIPFLFGLYMGLRISEVLALTWDDVDFENGLLTVNKTLTVDSSGAVHLVHWPKTISGMRTISIPDHLLSVLRESHATASVHVICGATKRMLSGPYISFSTFYIAFNKLRKSLGISLNLTFHCLRYTHASFLISNGVPIPLVSKRLGHATPNMTLSVYTHFVPGSDNVFKKNISMISDTFKGIRLAGETSHILVSKKRRSNYGLPLF